MKTSIKIDKRNNKDLVNQILVGNEILSKEKNESRNFVKFLYIENNVLYVTNTKELLKITSDVFSVLEDGYYDFIKKNSNEFFLVNADGIEGNFPNFDVILECEGLDPFEFFFENFHYNVCVLIQENNTIFNFDFIKKLEKISDHYAVYQKDRNSALIFKSNAIEYAVMPIKS